MLQVLKDLAFERECVLEVRLHSKDMLSLTACLPKTIFRLEILIPEGEHVYSTLLSEIVQRISNLKAISIRLYVGVHNGELGISPTFPQARFENKFPIIAESSDSDDDLVCEYKLKIIRSEAPVWAVGCERDTAYSDPIYSKTVVKFPKLEQEVMNWFRLNNNLVEIELFFDGDEDYNIEYYE